MDLTDRRLLNLVQGPFPMVQRPYQALAQKLDTTEQDIIERLIELKRTNVLRQISAIFDTRRLGYKTTLVAMAYEPDGTGSYATPHMSINETTYEWAHSIGEVVTAISNAGLNIVRLNEFPFTTQGDFMGCLDEDEHGLWRYLDSKHGVPLTYAIMARKPC